MKRWIFSYTRGVWLRTLDVFDTESARMERHWRRMDALEMEERLRLAGRWREFIPITKGQKKFYAKLTEKSGRIHLVNRA